MNKLATLGVSMLISLTLVSRVFAGSMTIKIEQPKTPTNLTELKINFVVLDYAANGPISVQCLYAKDGSIYSQFGSDVGIAQGGGSANCMTTSSQINGDGTYKFKVKAINSSETAESGEVTVVRDTSGPQTPTGYGKSRVNTCDYKINFHTADDGVTSKVEVYRSGQTSFTADDGSRVDTITIGPNTEGSSTTTPPVCDQEYYFAVRAFDSIGNGSGLVGDSVTVTVGTTTTTVTTTPASAIPAGTQGNILGVGAPEGATEALGAILGEEATPEAGYIPPQPRTPGRSAVLVAGAIAVILFGIWLAKRKKSV